LARSRGTAVLDAHVRNAKVRPFPCMCHYRL
jgi:hypothetical protein